MSTPVIETRGVTAGYGAVPAISDVTLRVDSGQVVLLLGANGAGKSTTVRTIAGILKPSIGEVYLRGGLVTSPLHKRARSGLRMVADDRGVIMALSVADNLRLLHRRFDECLELFPELAPLLNRKVGLLSGGEQQMVALSRALCGPVHALLADELSLGLGPLIVQRLLSSVRAAADRGVGILLVEQQLRQAIGIADYVYVLRRGQLVLQGGADDLRQNLDAIAREYLGNLPDKRTAVEGQGTGGGAQD